MMKKSCLWMPAAILACGLAASLCSKDDDPVTSADPVAPAATEQTQYEEMPAQPTADQLTTKITRPAFVFAGDYTGEGKALVARAVNAVGIDRAEVVIMPGALQAGVGDDGGARQQGCGGLFGQSLEERFHQERHHLDASGEAHSCRHEG